MQPTEKTKPIFLLHRPCHQKAIFTKEELSLKPIFFALKVRKNKSGILHGDQTESSILKFGLIFTH